MKKYFNSTIGRLRLLAFLEGVSLLILVFICVPVKYMLGDPVYVQAVGPVHGILFILFVINAFGVGTEYGWNFKTTTWKVLLASFIPFGTFYIDAKILKQMHLINT